MHPEANTSLLHPQLSIIHQRLGHRTQLMGSPNHHRLLIHQPGDGQFAQILEILDRLAGPLRGHARERAHPGDNQVKNRSALRKTFVLRPAKSCRAYAGRFAAPVRLSAAFAELRKRSSLFIGIYDDMSPERTSRIDRQFCLAFLSVPRSQLKKYSKILKLLAARMKYAILLL